MQNTPNKFKRVTFFLSKPIWSAWSLILIGSLVWVAVAVANDVETITDIEHWRHPVKRVFQKYKVELYKVELHNKTYPVFYVKFPYDPMLGHNDNYFHTVYYDILEANGFWDYAFVDSQDGIRINITWDKKTKALSENIEQVGPMP